jgi:6-phosphofructokinase 2
LRKRYAMTKRIVTITINPSLDKFTKISQVVPNDKLRCNAPEYQAGGGGINVSRAIHHLGGESLAIFPCGGQAGEIIKDKLRKKNIDFNAIPIKNATRENLTVFETSAKQAYRFIMPGPTLSENDWQKTLDIIQALSPVPDYLIASGSTPQGVPDDFYQRIAVIAKALGCRLVVDTSGEPLRLAAESGVYLLKPNMRELGYLVGHPIESEEDEIESARHLVDAGEAEVVVVSLGAGGALLVTEKNIEQLRSPTVPIRSKLGAGDSMVAGIVFGLSQGKNIRKAVQYGIAAGAATVMTAGTKLCNKNNTNMLYERLVNNT